MKLFELFTKLTQSAKLVERMTATIGVQEALADKPSRAAITRRAVERCCGCQESAHCARWLDENSSATHAPSYCRNGDLFDRLSREMTADLAT